MEKSKTLNTKIKQHRKALGFTQEELAKKANISYNSLTKIESGVIAKPSAATLEKIAKALNITLDNLLNMDKRPKTYGSDIYPFNSLNWEEFENLILAIVGSNPEFDNAEHYGGVGDKGRDVIGFKHLPRGKEKWYFNVKKYKSVSYNVFEKELNNINRHCQEEPGFSPKQIVFCVSGKPSPTAKDKSKKLAIKLNLPEPYFWGPFELTEKIKGAKGLAKRFFGGTIDELIGDVKRLKADNIEILKSKNDLLEECRLFRQQITSSVTDSVDYKANTNNQEVNKEIDKTIIQIDKKNYEEAEIELIKILGRIEPQTDNFIYEIARIYNNLGVISNRKPSRDIKKAEQYFNKALEVDSQFYKAEINLASIYLHKGETKDLEDAYNIATKLWKTKKESLVLQNLLWSIAWHKSAKEALDFVKNDKEAKKLIKDDDQLFNVLANINLANRDIDIALININQAISISPSNAGYLYFKAKCLLFKAQKECMIIKEFLIVPKFESYQLVNESLTLLRQSKELAEQNDELSVLPYIDVYILRCSVFLNRANETKFRQIRDELSEIRQIQDKALKEEIEHYDFVIEFQNRNFEAAHNKLMSINLWKRLPLDEKIRLALTFFLEGAPEQAKLIMEDPSVLENRKDDAGYWGNLSLIEILLDNRILAIKNIEKCKKIAINTNQEKQALSNFNAVMMRYAAQGEVDRLTKGVTEFHQKYPELEVVKMVKAIDDRGSPTEEIKKIFNDSKQHYERQRQIFRNNPMPTYLLEKTFKKPYVSILDTGLTNQDPEFIIDFHFPQREFCNQMGTNFKQSQVLVFDYASLLDLARMNLLGFLPKLNKKIIIRKELFFKIQEELLTVENADLRKLWNYVRKSDFISDDDINLNLKDEKFKELFDAWLIQSIKECKKPKTCFVTSDLRLIRLLKSEGVDSINTLTLLEQVAQQGLIDQKMYSQSIGRLAERLYIFIPFKAEDLLQIVLDNNSKVTLRSFHLVNQVFLPGSDIVSFFNVFKGFIGLLWKTGILPEEKIEWINFLSQTAIKAIFAQEKMENLNELEEIYKQTADAFVEMWFIAIGLSNKDELLLLKHLLENDHIYKQENFHILTDGLFNVIEQKLDSLSTKNE